MEVLYTQHTNAMPELDWVYTAALRKRFRTRGLSRSIGRAPAAHLDSIILLKWAPQIPHYDLWLGRFVATVLECRYLWSWSYRSLSLVASK